MDVRALLEDAALRDELLGRSAELLEGLGDGAEGLEGVLSDGDKLESALSGDVPDGLEAIILRFGRPAFLVQENDFDPDGAPATSEVVRDQVKAHRETITLMLPRVGRIDLKNHRLPFAGTGWVIAEDVVCTNRHVAEVFARSEGGTFTFKKASMNRTVEASLDFRQEFAVDAEDAHDVRSVLWVEQDGGPDMALLHVPGVGRPAVPLMTDDEYASLETGRWIAAIGYPAQDSRNDSEAQQEIFDGIFNVKRMQPGKLTSKRRYDDTALHDCTTLGGNSGSVLIDISSGSAVALHFGGHEGDTNRAVAVPAIRRILKAHGPGASRSSAAFERASVAAPGPVDPTPTPTPTPTTTHTMTVHANAGGVNVEVPVHIHIQVDGDTLANAERPAEPPERLPASMCCTRAPHDLAAVAASHERIAPPGDDGREGAAFMPILWPIGAHLKVRFLNGTAEMRRRVATIAKEWEKHAGIRLDFGDHRPSHIRISFEEVSASGDPDGYWSFLGTVAEEKAQDQATMSLSNLWDEAWMDANPHEVRGTVLHEFGHALGLIHEHQSPSAEIPWNRRLVYWYYERTQGWDRDMVDAQVLSRWDDPGVYASRHDRDSIMQYPVDEFLTRGDYAIGWNQELSRMDKRFIRRLYPFPESEDPSA